MLNLQLQTDQEIKKVLADPAVRDFAKYMINTALDMDPVDAVADLQLVAVLLNKRAIEIREMVRRGLVT